MERDEHGVAARCGRSALLSEIRVDGRADQVRARPDRDACLHSSSHTSETTSLREGGGFITLPSANDPLIFASPTGLSFGLMRGGTTATRSISFTDAGGGAGQGLSGSTGVRARGGASPPVLRPGAGTLQVTAKPPAGQQEDVTGFIVLTKGTASRRLPFWFHIEAPQLPRQPHGKLQKTGTYKGNTKRRGALVANYRYPDNPTGVDIPANLPGPEQAFTVRLTKPVANFGVAILNQGAGVAIEPRVVAEQRREPADRLSGAPDQSQPLRDQFFSLIPAAGAILPAGDATTSSSTPRAVRTPELSPSASGSTT